jgi:hypothetical protein
MSYRTWLPAQAPPPLAGPNGTALLQRLGEMFDEQRDRLLQGVLARFPVQGSVDGNGTYSTPPSDALDAMGVDRGLPRAASEVILVADSVAVAAAKDALYAARLQAAWDTWDYAGSHYGVLRALEAGGYSSPKAIIVQDNGRWSQLAGTIADLAFGTLAACVNRPSSAPGWFFDFQTDFYARFALVYTSMPTALNTKSGQTVHNQIVNLWGSAKTNFVGTSVITGGRIWGFAASPVTLPVWGTGTWGGSTYQWTDGVTTLPIIPPNV